MIHPSHESCSRELDRCEPYWSQQTRDGEHTPSDLLWCGIVSGRMPDWLRGTRHDRAKDNPAWRAMISRAKADIDAIDSEWRVKRLAAACTPADIEAFLEAMK